MTIKKLAFCILCFANAANLAEEEDFNEESSSKAVVEDNVFINKNTWNTRKWGSIYFLFPRGLFEWVLRLVDLRKEDFPCCYSVLFSFLPYLSGGVRYQYLFHKNCGINIDLSVGFQSTHNFKKEKKWVYSLLRINFSPSFEYIYKKKGKHIFSGAFSFIGAILYKCIISSIKEKNIISSIKEKKNLPSELFFRIPVFVHFDFFKYQYNQCLLLECCTLHIPLLYNLLDLKRSINFLKENKVDFSFIITLFLTNIKIHLNIIGLNDLRKKRKKNIDLI